MKGSIEYAIAELNVPLVVVLGHTNCGAVKAAVTHIDQKDSLPGSINGLVELIKPVAVKVQSQRGDIDNVIRANVDAGVEKLRNLEPVLAPRVKAGSVKVVGGIYDLRTGKVELQKAIDASGQASWRAYRRTIDAKNGRVQKSVGCIYWAEGLRPKY